MQKSLIRRYCTRICKATAVGIGEKKCKDPDCLRGEGKLFCSIYICSYLEEVLNIPHYRYYYARYFLEIEWKEKLAAILTTIHYRWRSLARISSQKTMDRFNYKASEPTESSTNHKVSPSPKD